MIDKKIDFKRILFVSIFTLCSIGINYLGSVLAGLIAFPLYLDSVMTIAVTALCGLIPGLICAVGSNTLLYFFAHTGILFTLSHISTVVVAYLFFKHEKKIKTSEQSPFYPFIILLYVDRIYCSYHQFNFGRYNQCNFLQSQHFHSSGRQRRSGNLCCNPKSYCGSLHWRNTYKSCR